MVKKKAGKNRISNFKFYLGRLLRGALLLISVVLFLYFVGVMVGDYREIVELDAQIEEVEEEIRREERVHEELERRIELLEDEDYIEVMARKYLRLIKPGDVPLNWTSTEIR
ncbi:MAG: septum formation initiator family protein [Clostridia bacterium]